MIAVAYHARSAQLAAAARLLAISWIFSLQIWMAFDGAERSLAFAALDVALAAALYFMSNKRWFPVPLFFLHASLVIYHLYTAFIGSSIIWIAAFINRAFEMAVLYVIACSVYRIYMTRSAINR